MTGWYVNLKYRYKLLITYLALSIVPLLVLGGYAYTTSANYAKRETLSKLDQVLEQSASNIAFHVRGVAGAADTFVRGRRIQQILSRARQGYPEKPEEIDDFHLLIDLLQSIEDYDYVLNARIYIRPEVLYTRENTNIFHMSQLAERYVLETDRSMSVWEVGSFEHEYYAGIAKTLRLTRTIPDLGSPEPHLAVLQVDCRMDILDNAIGVVPRDVGTAVIVHDGDTVVAGNDGSRLTAQEAAAVCVEHGAAPSSRNAGNSGAASGAASGASGLPYLIASAEIPGLPWLLTAVVPIAEVTAASRRVTMFTALFALVLIVVDVFAAIHLSRTNTRRMDALLTGMRKVTAGHYKQLVTVEGRDEIGQLQRQYNQMVRAVNSLIRRVKLVTNKKREAEFKALESQINPHFLYNTLENIKWMAIRHGAPEIVSIVESLSSLYRFTLNRGKEIVTVREEIASVEEYVAIQNLRFGNRIRAEFDLSPGVGDCRMTKMILQPLVENAIYHGIHAKEGRRGRIHVDAEAENAGILIHVADDGVGMSKDKLERILKTDSAGYGVKNVHQRLQLYYGADYGLSYRSFPGRGTTVTVRVPRTE